MVIQLTEMIGYDEILTDRRNRTDQINADSRSKVAFLVKGALIVTGALVANRQSRRRTSITDTA